MAGRETAAKFNSCNINNVGLWAIPGSTHARVRAPKRTRMHWGNNACPRRAFRSQLLYLEHNRIRNSFVRPTNYVSSDNLAPLCCLLQRPANDWGSTRLLRIRGACGLGLGGHCTHVRHGAAQLGRLITWSAYRRHLTWLQPPPARCTSTQLGIST